MIIQCDHCRARFRMDDSKLANGPVKVRCAKCKEVFVVRPEEPAAERSVPPVPVAPAAVDQDSADFSFDIPSGPGETPAQEGSDFSFDSAARPAIKEDFSAQQDADNEFDWQATVPSSPSSFDKDSDFNLSSFDASLAAASAPAHEAPAAADNNDFDFGDVDINAAAASSAESTAAAGSSLTDEFAMDFGEVSFSDNPVEPAGTAEPISAGTPAVDEPAAPDDFLLSFNREAEQQQTPAAAAKEKLENVTFDDFSFADKGESGATESVSPAPAPQHEALSGLAAVGLPADNEEDLPPSSLTSRKKSGSNFPLLVIVGAIILVVVLAGAGVYFFGGPKAFSKVGLGFMVDWYGGKASEEGNISLKGVTASYVVNSTAGELFVVRGEAVNNYKKPRASIQVKVSLLGTGGTVLVTKSAYCGNPLSNEQLATLPLAKLEETMNNQFGDSLANLGLKPGDALPFVVVISPLPKDATDYNVVVGGSIGATQ